MLKIISAQRYYDPDAPGEVETLPEEVDLPILSPEDLGEYTEPEEDEEQIIEQPPRGYDITDTFLDEIQPVAQDELDIIKEAIDDQQCISFEYTTRKGNYAGWRLIEPHGEWRTLRTGNHLVVGFDRHRQGIRAFIIDNMHPGTLKVMPGEFYSFQPKFIFNPQY